MFPDDPSPRQSPYFRLGILILLAGLGLSLGMFLLLRRIPRPKAAPAPAPAASPSAASGLPAHAGASGTQLKLSQAAADLIRIIAQARDALLDPANPHKREALAALRAALDRLQAEDPAAAIAAIKEFLATGEDAPTGERFKVGPGGKLAGAPTLRTLLLDRLGIVSQATGSDDAAEVSRAILDSKGTPDEWAVAMRNVAWADPQGSKAYLADKALQLINDPAWQQNPTGGYFEAFDALAYSGNPQMLSVLLPMTKNPGPLQQAAVVAADRLTAMAPLAVADYLNSNPSLLADLPMIRADYMGKLYLADPAQETQAETYLDRTDVAPDEKTKFLGRLEVPAGFSADSLLTPSQPSGPTVLDRRAAANQVASEWLASNRYPALQEQLSDLVRYTQPATP